MTPEELSATLKEAILRKEVRLKQGDFGVFAANGIFVANNECQCALGVWMLGQQNASLEFVEFLISRLEIDNDQLVDFTDGFDQYPTDPFIHTGDRPTYYRVGYEIAAWADELGILER